MRKVGGSAPEPSSPPRHKWARIPNQTSEARLFAVAVAFAVALGLLRRAAFGLDAPLWLDETFTAAVAIQPTFGGLINDLLNDVPGPVYYTLMWVWEKMFGASNLSLRIPSLIFGIGAPVLIMLKGHPDRSTRLLWAAFAALWFPAFYYATEARAYSLLFFLGAVQIMLFLRMVAHPCLRNAAYWAAASALFILTHYYAGLVTAFQGLAFLALRPKDALRAWPAALLFAPVPLWMYFHLPLLVRFSTPEAAWQELLGPADLPHLAHLMFGVSTLVSTAAVAVVAGGAVYEAYARRGERTPPPLSRAELAAAAASILAIMVVVTLGFVRPNYTPRYLMPLMPGALLGAAIWTRVLAHRFRLLPWIVLAALLLMLVWETSSRMRSGDPRADLSWERASRDLAQAGARRLIFTWDHPTALVTPPSLMARVGSLFFDRAGIQMPTQAVKLAGRADLDPNQALLAAAGQPGDAILWVYEVDLRRTAAVRHPPALNRLDPRLQCRNYGGERRVVLACLRVE